jgi:hypothetical protein
LQEIGPELLDKDLGLLENRAGLPDGYKRERHFHHPELPENRPKSYEADHNC